VFFLWVPFQSLVIHFQVIFCPCWYRQSMIGHSAAFMSLE
jgi:hypothetical protein